MHFFLLDFNLELCDRRFYYGLFFTGGILLFTIVSIIVNGPGVGIRRIVIFRPILVHMLPCLMPTTIAKFYILLHPLQFIYFVCLAQHIVAVYFHSYSDPVS